MTIRVKTATNVALNMVVNQLQLERLGEKVTQDEAIWYLIESARPKIADEVRITLESVKRAQADKAANS